MTAVCRAVAAGAARRLGLPGRQKLARPAVDLDFQRPYPHRTYSGAYPDSASILATSLAASALPLASSSASSVLVLARKASVLALASASPLACSACSLASSACSLACCFASSLAISAFFFASLLASSACSFASFLAASPSASSFASSFLERLTKGRIRCGAVEVLRHGETSSFGRVVGSYRADSAGA